MLYTVFSDKMQKMYTTFSNEYEFTQTGKACEFAHYSMSCNKNLPCTKLFSFNRNYITNSHRGGGQWRFGKIPKVGHSLVLKASLI